MKLKNFLLAGIAASITDFLLGWLFYGILFMDYFGGSEPANLGYIAVGCAGFGFMIAYIFVRWANIVTFTAGMQAGAWIGFFMGIMRNFFDAAMKTDAIDMQIMAVDLFIGIVMGAIIGGVTGAVNGSLSKPSAA